MNPNRNGGMKRQAAGPKACKAESEQKTSGLVELVWHSQEKDTSEMASQGGSISSCLQSGRTKPAERRAEGKPFFRSGFRGIDPQPLPSQHWAAGIRGSNPASTVRPRESRSREEYDRYNLSPSQPPQDWSHLQGLSRLEDITFIHEGKPRKGQSFPRQHPDIDRLPPSFADRDARLGARERRLWLASQHV